MLCWTCKLCAGSSSTRTSGRVGRHLPCTWVRPSGVTEWKRARGEARQVLAEVKKMRKRLKAMSSPQPWRKDNKFLATMAKARASEAGKDRFADLAAIGRGLLLGKHFPGTDRICAKAMQ